MTTRNLLLTLIVGLSAALFYLIAFWQPLSPGVVARIESHGQLPQAQVAPPGGDFVLQGPRGSVALADYRGKVVLIYFGYTYCPDVCPTALSLLAQALSELTVDERDRVQCLFISLDPERDSATRLRQYTPFFHPGIIGLSGSPAQIARVAEQYGCSYRKQAPDADGRYTVDHSSATYVIDPQGKLAGRLPHGASPAQLLAAVRRQLNPAHTP